MSDEQKDNFKDSTQLTKWIKWFLYAQIIITIAAVISGQLEYRFLSDINSGVYVTQESLYVVAEANDARQFVVAIAQLIALVGLGILICIWIYRANYNARQLGAEGMVFTPGWSVGWYFIPIFNLWKPYQAMKEIWKASSNPQSWESQTVSPLLSLWWFFWIVSSILGRISFKLSYKAEEIHEFISANIATQISDIADIPLSIVMIFLVSKVYTMQMSHIQLKNEKIM